jgi:hypothetical protein
MVKSSLTVIPFSVQKKECGMGDSEFPTPSNFSSFACCCEAALHRTTQACRTRKKLDWSSTNESDVLFKQFLNAIIARVAPVRNGILNIEKETQANCAE